ncbi:transglutaminase family protein [Thalassotalea profundi]|uniref:Transglutaminase n=1 Tax=Thalassotalea profundi TaxID=2036687 RepID=A0ABQ3IS26_9GAMM|nr:DUF3488 and transglutaminase-like domain-containing protein [Thalassotalea profundi]GHE91095.1 transglutaminase [Thalassotalea profundi]
MDDTIEIAAKKQQVQWSLAKNTQFLLMITLALNCLLLILELSSWLIAFIVISVLWQSCIYFKVISQPNKLIKMLVSISGLILLALSAKGLGLLNSMVHLLVFSYLLKPLEIHAQKDFYIQVLLGIFVLVTSLVFIQSLYFMLLILLVLVTNFMLLMSAFKQTESYKTLAKQVSKTLVKSLPLALILFIGFPKIAPFWQMPSAKNAEVGLSDEVKVGDIANLALSNKLAFRVEFEQAPPNYQQMYWRTLVLEDFDGSKWYQQKKNHRSWQRQPKREEAELSLISGLSTLPTVSYQIIAEPSYQKWLFALNVMTDASSEQQKLNKNVNLTLSAEKILNSVTSYQVTSALTNQVNTPLSSEVRSRNLAVSVTNNQQLVAEGKRLRELYSDDLNLVNAVLSRFNQQNYHYTLNPPLLSNNNLAEFYFDTKAGFCEHYASSFTYLMRSAGIPARMVLGYMGGEYNERGNYFSIYQRDAHAWSEVWIKGLGWQRIDPTAAVSPERVERGFSQSLQQEQSLLSSDFLSSFNTSLWFSQLRYMLEAIDYQWTKWVVGYSINDQINVIKHIYLFFAEYKSFLATLSLLLIFLVVIFIVLRIKHKKSQHSQTALLLYQLMSLATKVGVVKNRSMTIDQFALKFIEKKPTFKLAIVRFVDGYKKLQYQALSSEEKKKELTNLKHLYQQLRQQIKHEI